MRRYTSDIVEGLWFLHSKKFIHRDIKPTNLLVSGGRVKLGDFGCSTSIVEDESMYVLFVLVVVLIICAVFIALLWGFSFCLIDWTVLTPPWRGLLYTWHPK